MDELRRRFTIDDRLGRFSKALKSLHEMGPNAFEETRRYTMQKELYTKALDLYKYDQESLMVDTPFGGGERTLLIVGLGHHARLCNFSLRSQSIP
jgi:hypothetical protein